MAIRGTYRQLVCDTEEDLNSIELADGEGAICYVLTTPRTLYVWSNGGWELAPSGETFPDKTGQAGNYVRVNDTEDGFEFVTLAGGGDMLGVNNLSDVADPDTARDNLNAEEQGVAASEAAAAQSASQSYTDDEIATLAAAITALLANKSNTGHTHTASEVTDFQTAVSANADVTALKAIVDAGGSDGDSIVDTVAELLAVFSTYPEGADIATLINGKANASHDHTAANITDFATAALIAAPAETLATISALVAAAASKSAIVDADSVYGIDSEAGNAGKRFTWTNIKAFLKTYFDGIYTTTSAVASQITTALSGYAALAGATFTGAIVAAVGTTALTPFKMQSGVNRTTPGAGDFEYDGVSFFQTKDTTSSRGESVIEHRFKLDAIITAFGPAISNFFGANSNIPLVANAYYEIEIIAWFLKTTAGTVTWTLTNSAAPTSQNIEFEMSPVGGIVAPPGTATTLRGEIYNDTTAARTIVTASLTTAVNHKHKIRIWLRNGSGTSLTIKITSGAGTVTPGIGSRWTCKRISPNNVGAFVA